jgi:thioredoxin 1
MPTLQVNEENFGATIKEGIVVLDVWAAWCGPCRVFAPVFEAAATRHTDVVFGKIDAEAQPGLAAAFEIRAIPTLMVLRDGVLLASLPGAMTAAGLDELVQKVREIDMDEVRRKLDAESAAADAPNTDGA